MRLKRLSIRNIASIETGEIDFEKGLTDPATGKPAPLFLITGDTGAGKTVILDCISMALYRKTPRQTGVLNRQNNEFLTTDGEKLNIGDLCQYTRIGISAKSECYTQLVFEGNDGCEYTARLELGMMRRNRAAKGTLQHRTPKWSVRKGEGPEISLVKDVQAIIFSAVGLTFEQFGRMAMLAQGQFAAFLTGDKKEREAILEQLTNTEIFSRYGDAIKNIFTRTKQENDAVCRELEAVSSRRLSPEERKGLEEESGHIVSRLKGLAEEQEGLESRKRDTETVIKRDAEILEIEGQLKLLRDKECDEEHAAMRALVKGWDSTSAQRQWLIQLNKARTQLEDGYAKIPKLRSRYNELYADLAYKLRYQSELWEKKANEEKWLADNEAFQPLARQALTIIARLQSYRSMSDKITAERARESSCSKRAAELAESVISLKESYLKAAKALELKQEEIDLKAAEAKSYDMQALSAEQTMLQSGFDISIRISEAIPQLADAHKLLLERKGRVVTQEKELAELGPAIERTEKNLSEARRLEEEALKIRDMFENGLTDAMAKLRMRMASTGAEICPLCGQHVEYIEGAEALVRAACDKEEVRVAKTKKIRTDAEKDFKELLERRSKLSGSISTEKKSIDNDERSQRERICRLELDGNKAGLQLSLPTPDKDFDAGTYDVWRQLIDGYQTTIREKLDEVRKQIASANAVNTKLRELNEERKPLEKAVDKSSRALADAEKASEKIQTEILHIRTSLSSLTEEAGHIVEELGILSSGKYEGWEKEPAAVEAAFKADCKDYESHEKALDLVGREGERLVSLIEHLDNHRAAVIELFPDWKGAVEPVSLDAQNVGILWQKLVADIGVSQESIRRYNEDIANLTAALDEWCRSTGESLEILESFNRSEPEVDKARKALGTLRERIVSVESTASRMKKEREDAFARLNLGPDEPLPLIEVMDGALGRIASEREALTERRGMILERFSRADADEEEFKKIQLRCEESEVKMKKWNLINGYFGGTRFRTLVQSHILRPLLNNANIYLSRITDQYRLTCSDDNEQLSVLVIDLYNKGQVRSATVLSGGERFMVSLALSLALSSLNRQDMNVDILFIDEGFGTLDGHVLDSVMSTLEKLQEIAGQAGRRVGVISHREELDERIPVQIRVRKHGDGRSRIEFS